MNSWNVVKQILYYIYAMIKLCEPLERLTRLPTSFVKNTDFLPPEKIKIYDDTLRDGEQMPGVAFSPQQKLELAKLLSDIGVDVMDVGFPVVSQADIAAIKLCLAARERGEIRSGVEILAMCRATKTDIDAAAQTAKAAGLPPSSLAILILSTLSDLHLKYKLGKTLLKKEGKPEDNWLNLPIDFYREANIKLITSAITYAREAGFEKVEFAAEDGSRCHLDYAEKWTKACIAAGGTRLCFSDTVGCLSPEAVDYYFKPLVELTRKAGIELHAHFHNDLAIGAYNCARALSHGASHAGVTACGIGERAGNAPLEQVVMILKLIYGIELPRFKYHRLVELRRLVEKFSGIPMQPHAPIVGEGVFYHESGIHTAGIAINPAIYQFIPEDTVGGNRRFVFGKHTGSAAVEEVLKKHEKLLSEAGVEINDTLVKNLAERVKEIREAQTGNGKAGNIITRYYQDYYSLGISEEELLAMALNEKPITSSLRA